MEWIVVGVPGLLAGAMLFWWIRARPVRGLYLSFAANGFLMTRSLPVVEERIAAPEVVMVLTWAAMASSPYARRSPTLPLMHVQRTSLALAGAFAGVAFVSFFVNNLLFYGALAASAVQTMNYAYGFLMFATVVKLVDDWDKWSRCLIAWISGAALVSVVGVWALIGEAPAWAYSEWGGRISSTLKFENQVPSFLLPILPAVIFLALMRDVAPRWRMLLLLLIPALTATAFGSGSRTALGMVAISVVGTVWVAAREARHRAFDALLMTQLGLVLVITVSAVLAYLAASYPVADHPLGPIPAWQRGFVMIANWWAGDSPFDDTRVAQIALAFDNLPDFLIFGTGPAMFTPRFRHDEVHNTYVGVLIEIGLVGFVVLMAWLMQVMHASWRSVGGCVRPSHRLLTQALLVGFVVLLAYGLFMFGLRQRNIWLLAGLLMAVPRLNGSSRVSAGVGLQPPQARHVPLRQQPG